MKKGKKTIWWILFGFFVLMTVSSFSVTPEFEATAKDLFFYRFGGSLIFLALAIGFFIETGALGLKEKINLGSKKKHVLFWVILVVLGITGFSTVNGMTSDKFKADLEASQPSPTPKPTATPKPTYTPKPTATPKPTNTPKPTASPVPTATPKPTVTIRPTNTPAPTATSTPIPTPTSALLTATNGYRFKNSVDDVTLVFEEIYTVEEWKGVKPHNGVFLIMKATAASETVSDRQYTFPYTIVDSFGKEYLSMNHDYKYDYEDSRGNLIDIATEINPECVAVKGEGKVQAYNTNIVSGGNGTRYLIFDIPLKVATDSKSYLIFNGTANGYYEEEVVDIKLYFSEFVEGVTKNVVTPTATPTATPKPTNTPTPVPTLTPVPEEDSTFSVTYLDVGQGDAAVIECDGHYMMIDGGDSSCSSQIYTYLKNNGIKHLDIVVASHEHSDHVGGLAGALNYATADLVLCPVTSDDTKAFESFKKYADANGNGIVVPKEQATYKLGSADIRIISLNAGKDNDSSIILSITYKDFTFLFTGDAEYEAEKYAVESYEEQLDADFLKVPHHGSESSTIYSFLRAVMPQFAIISCGAGNSYGHPVEATLSRLQDAETEILRTDLNGDIVVKYNAGEWIIEMEKDASLEDIMTPGSDFSFIPDNTPEDTADVDKNNTGTSDKTYDYIANKNTGKFHYPSCSSVKRMSEKNKVFFYDVTRTEMIDKGYDPCQNCNP